jgi:hypothetical protein
MIYPDETVEVFDSEGNLLKSREDCDEEVLKELMKTNYNSKNE